MGYQALYRRYRPARFEDFVGQEAVIKTLRSQITSGRIAHAYLFCGTRGTGKTSTAKVFARAVNCEHPENGDPCGTCDTCRALREAGHEPVCVEACPMRAIEFSEMDDLRATHPDAVSELPCTEPAATTTPNILIGASRGALLEDFNPVVL